MFTTKASRTSVTMAVIIATETIATETIAITVASIASAEITDNDFLSSRQRC